MKSKEKIIQAMGVINFSQQQIWNLHHEVNQYDKDLGEKIWAQTLQIEHALLILNEEILGGHGFFEEHTTHAECLKERK